MPSFNRMSWVCSVSLNYSPETAGKFLYLLQHRTLASPLPPQAMLHVVSIVTQHSAVLTGPQADSSERRCRCQPQPTLKWDGVSGKEAERETKHTKRELGRQRPLSIPVRDSIISGLDLVCDFPIPISREDNAMVWMSPPRLALELIGSSAAWNGGASEQQSDYDGRIITTVKWASCSGRGFW